MSWHTLVPDGRATLGVALGYSVRVRKDKAGAVVLAFAISAKMLRAAKWQDDTPVRLDVDLGRSIGRLTSVAGMSKAARRVQVTKSGRATLSWPCNGAVAEVFGSVARSMTALASAEATSEGIVFELPAANGRAA